MCDARRGELQRKIKWMWDFIQEWREFGDNRVSSQPIVYRIEATNQHSFGFYGFRII